VKKEWRQNPKRGKKDGHWEILINRKGKTSVFLVEGRGPFPFASGGQEDITINRGREEAVSLEGEGPAVAQQKKRSLNEK